MPVDMPFVWDADWAKAALEGWNGHAAHAQQDAAPAELRHTEGCLGGGYGGPCTCAVSPSDATGNEPKPCQQCDPSVGYVCEEHGDDDEADAYRHACEIMEQFQAERAKRGVEIGTQGSLCDGIAWLYQKLEELESPTATGKADAASAGGLPAELSKAFVTLESSGGEGRTIVLKFNQREDAYAVHDFLLKGGGKEYTYGATSAADVEHLRQLKHEVCMMYQALDDGEWAEHVAVTPEGQCLETAITKFVGKVAATSAADAMDAERECQYPHESTECKGCGWTEGAAIAASRQGGEA
jgi:hypothetical protein